MTSVRSTKILLAFGSAKRFAVLRRSSNRMRWGDVGALYQGRMTGLVWRSLGVPQLDGEGTHDACFYLRKIICPCGRWTACSAGREATRCARSASASFFRGARPAQPACPVIRDAELHAAQITPHVSPTSSNGIAAITRRLRVSAGATQQQAAPSLDRDVLHRHQPARPIGCGHAARLRRQQP